MMMKLMMMMIEDVLVFCCTCLHIWVLFLSFFELCRIVSTSYGIPR